MNTPKWIEDKAEEHIDDKFSLKVPSETLDDNHPVKSTIGECKIFARNDYIAGAMEVYQEMEKWKEVATNLCRKLQVLDLYTHYDGTELNESVKEVVENAIKQYEKLRDDADK